MQKRTQEREIRIGRIEDGRRVFELGQQRQPHYPWSQSAERRADPRNGVALNALHDRAFGRGLITFDEQLRVLPERFRPDPDGIAWHCDSVFTPWTRLAWE